MWYIEKGEINGMDGSGRALASLSRWENGGGHDIVNTGSTKRIATIADSTLATVLGIPAEVGKSSRFFIDVDGADMAADLVGRSANRRRFVYRFYET